MRVARAIASGALIALLSAGCGDDGGAPGDGSTGTGEATTTGPSTSAASTSTTSMSSTGEETGEPSTGEPDTTEGSAESGESSSSTGAPVEPMLEVIAAFDPAMGQLPEGLALRDDDAFVAFAPTGQVWRVDTTGAREPEVFASVPPLPPNMAFITGLAFDDQDRLLVALPSFAPEVTTGIYRAPADGGDATLFSTHAMMGFPSAIRQHADGDLFVTDSFSAAVFRIDPAGEASIWITDPLLAGQASFCGHDALFDIGANGLVVTDDRVLVAVSHAATVVEIPIEAGGAAGTPTVLAGPDCDAIGGIDGMDLGADGRLYAAVNDGNELVRIDDAGTVELVTADEQLDFPATVRIGTADGEPALYVTSFALPNAMAGLPAAPSLARWWPLELE
jgi:sugar lactone lactonase YvrE